MNNTFTDWFWQYAFMSDNPTVLAHIAVEAKAFVDDPDSKEPRYFVEHAMLLTDDQLLIQIKNPTKH